MTKKQKIWLAVFLAMFLVPEILWSPIGNFYYLIFFAEEWNEQTAQFFNMASLPDSGIIRLIIGIVEIIGLLLFVGTILFFYRGRQKFIKIFAIILMLILLLLLFYVFIFSLNFNPRVG